MPVRSRQAAPRRSRRPAAIASAGDRPRTVLTVGVTDYDAQWLGKIHDPQRFHYRPVGDFAQADNPELCRPRSFVREAVAEVRRSGERAHGVVAFDDYPATLLAAAIAEKLGLPGPSLASMVICNNKAWSRMLQKAVVPKAVPRFQIIDPRRNLRTGDLRLAFPFWLKPVKSSMSYLGFRIASFAEFERAVALSRAGLPAYTAAFQEFMGMTGPPLPGAAASVRADWLIAEELLSGRQCTLDGLMSDGELTLIGVVDSIRLPNRVSFARFDYPSRLHRATQEKMAEIARRVLRRIGFDDGLFNIEFFVDERGESPKIIEINPRFSPQFSDLFEKVDGTLTHQHLVEMATGDKPMVTKRRGRHRIAASCVLRVARDHLVMRAPTDRDLARLATAIPGAHVQVTTEAGHRLSESVQDSYTYRYGLIHLGARDRRDLKRKLAKAKKLLGYRLEPVE
jgi:biotin carboxylase